MQVRNLLVFIGVGVSVGLCSVIRQIASGNQQDPPIHSPNWNFFPNTPKRDPFTRKHSMHDISGDKV